jgi:hypothetical protein
MLADDVLHHDDGVIDHEAGGDRQRHQREIVQAVAQQVHGPKVPMSESGTATAGIRWRGVAQEDEHHHHHQDDRDDQRFLDIAHRIADRDGGSVDHQRTRLIAGGMRGLQLGHDGADAVDHSITLAPGCLVR